MNTLINLFAPSPSEQVVNAGTALVLGEGDRGTRTEALTSVANSAFRAGAVAAFRLSALLGAAFNVVTFVIWWRFA